MQVGFLELHVRRINQARGGQAPNHSSEANVQEGDSGLSSLELVPEV